MNNDIGEELKNTELYNELKELDEIYKELNIREDKFCDEFNIHCVKGCGKCCEHFIPDLSEIESDYLAYFLIKDNRVDEVMNKISYYKGEACPLYDKDSIYHCTVYNYRPLICRLFGASASQNKLGEPVYRNCKWNNIKNKASTSEMKNHIDDIVEMGEYGLRVDEIRCDEENKELITMILSKSIEKISLLIELEEESNK